MTRRRVQGACEGLQIIQLARSITTTDHRADRGSRDDIGDDPCACQNPQHADMGPPARGAAAKRDGRSSACGRARVMRFPPMHFHLP